MGIENGKARAWGRSRPFTLPDGQRVVVRRLSLLTLLAKGIIPDYLTGMAIAANEGKQLVTPNDPETFKTFSRFVDFVVSRALVEPKVWYDTGEQPDPAPPPEVLASGEVTPISEVPDRSKGLIFQYCMGAPLPKEWFDGYAPPVPPAAEKEDIPDLTPFRPVAEGADPGGDREGVVADAGRPDRPPAGGS